MIKSNIMYIFKYLLLSILYICIIMLFNKVSTNELFIVSWFSNISFVSIIYDIYKKRNNFMDYGLIFLIIIFLFCNGQLLLFSFGISPKKLSIFNYGVDKIFYASIYFLFSYIMMGLAFLFNKHDLNNDGEGTSKNVDLEIKRFAYICLIIFAVPFLYNKVGIFITSVKYGYDYIYYGNNSGFSFGDVINYLSNLFLISLLMLLYVYRNNKIYRRIYIFSIITIIIMYFITGMRGSALTLLICLLLVYFQYINTKKSSNFVVLFIIMIFTFTIVPIIKDFRSSSNKNIADLGNVIVSSKDENGVIRTISEIGGSMAPFIMVYNIIPSKYGYRYGLSYFSSFMAILPSRLYFTTFFTDNAGLDLWLMKAYKMSYGPGFSIMAESYYNFGYIGGIIFSFVLGCFFSWVLYYQSKDPKYHNLNSLLSIAFLLMSLMIARGSFFHVPKCIIYLMMLPFLVIKYFVYRQENI